MRASQGGGSTLDLSQNFFVRSDVVAAIVQAAGLTPDDLVIDVGAGHGIITETMAPLVNSVVAIELDETLASKLQLRARKLGNVQVIIGDIFDYRPPSSRYKVVSNPPFSIMSDVVRKFVFSGSCPDSMHLVMEKAAARKFCGTNGSTALSLMISYIYSVDIDRDVPRSAFRPAPTRPIVVCRFLKKPRRALDRSLYYSLISFVFHAWRPTIGSALSDVLSGRQIARLNHDLDGALDLKPSQASSAVWERIGLACQALLGEEPRRRLVGSQQSVVASLMATQRRDRPRRRVAGRMVRTGSAAFRRRSYRRGSSA